MSLDPAQDRVDDELERREREAEFVKRNAPNELNPVFASILATAAATSFLHAFDKAAQPARFAPSIAPVIQKCDAAECRVCKRERRA